MATARTSTGTGAADLDELLQESEALLDRLKSTETPSNRLFFDGSSSLASPGSSSLIGPTPETLAAAGERPSNSMGSATSDVGSSIDERGTPKAKTNPQPNLAPPPRPQWEKVSSALTGGDATT